MSVDDVKIIVYIAGPTAGGKTTVAEMLAEKTGAYRTRGSQLLSEIAKDRGIPTDKASLQNLYLTERVVHGENFLARQVAEKVCSAPTRVAIGEGVRRVADIEAIEELNEMYKYQLVFLYIDASATVRFNRYNQRQISLGFSPITYSDFVALEENPAEDELTIVRDMIQKRGVVIQTDTLTKEAMFAEVLKVIPHF